MTSEAKVPPRNDPAAIANAIAGCSRQLPALEPATAPFWTGGKDGHLLICRCTACMRYMHPPLPRCPHCGAEVVFSPVSGRGRVATHTVNHQPWLPGMPVPFVFAAVELVEQSELYVLSNITGCCVEAVHAGMAVEVYFEQHEDLFLPLFRLCEGEHAG